MKKRIFAFLGILLLASTSFAAPFLVCDPQAGVTQYTVEIKQGTAIIETATFAAQPDGSAKWDLAKYAVGSYSFKLKGADAQGWWGDLSDPFVATKAAKSTGLKIIP